MPELTEFDVVFYHGGCTDGEMGALLFRYWLSRKGMNDVPQFVPMAAGAYPSNIDVTGRRILMIDVCPKREEIIKILS